MSKSNTKELAQCLAFAYFAENPNYTQPNHDINFYSLFDSQQNVTKYKVKYLSKTFPIDVVKKDFVVTKTINEKTKKETTSYHITAKKVYKVALECVKKQLFKNSLDSYYFLDQKDPFVLLLKDETLANIKKALKLPFKIDILSSVDIIAVSKTTKKTIEQEFKKTFDAKTIIEQIFINKKNYAELIEKYLITGDLYPISLKLPSILSITPKIKLISNKRTIHDKIDIDPYIKFLSIILNNPEKSMSLINKCIEIDFDNFNIYNEQSWIFPINFNYNKIINPLTKKPLENYQLRFDLRAQGKGAGWNGMFHKITREHKDVQWVGGVGPVTFEFFARKFPEYPAIIKKVADIRVKVFEDILKEYNIKSDDSQDIINILNRHRIINNKSVFDKLIKFFEPYPSKTKLTLYQQYKENVINAITKETKNYSRDNKENYLDAHFIHAQISYFLLMGGYRFKIYFKQRMFLTLFGLITKQSHKIFSLYDYMGMKTAIETEMETQNKKIAAQFSTAPHYIIS